MAPQRVADAAAPEPRLTQRAHAALAAALRPGDLAADLTAGNGHDTAFLAAAVGAAGRVLAFDVQSEAIAATRRHLEERGLLERVELHLADHTRLAEHLAGRTLAAAALNLGYLPGAASRDIVTHPDTTLAALAQALDHLRPGGVVTVLAYTGHAGGREEAAAVLRFVRTLGRARFDVSRERTSRAREAPRLVIVTRR